MKKIILGNEAIAWGMYHSHVDVLSGYPGTPSSEILKSFQDIKEQEKFEAFAEWSSNEKVGLEVAYAAAVSGKRAAATMKQVGLNVACDALFSAAFIGVRGGMVLISADDPGFHSSQTEQDSRGMAKMAQVPVLDPADPQDAYDLMKKGFELSEKFECITIFRPVTRVCHSRQSVTMEENFEFNPNKGKFKRDIPRWAAAPRGPRLKQGYELIEKNKAIEEYNWTEFIEPKIKKLKGKGVLILTSGTCYGFAQEAMDDLDLDHDVLKLDMPYPLPVEKMHAWMEGYDQVLVIEETTPVIEEQIRTSKVKGKRTGDVFIIDEVTNERVLLALKSIGAYEGENIYAAETYDGELSVRVPQLCPGCPHRDVYYAAKKVFKKRAVYPSDIGCYTLGLNQKGIDSILCMGASVSMAAGFSIAEPGKTVVASIGDSTFLHSGVEPLLSAVYNKSRFILLILDNSITAMTGRQPTLENSSNIDIKKLVEAMGVKVLEYDYSNDLNKSIDFMEQLKSAYEENTDGPTVAVINEFCVLHKPDAAVKLPGEFAMADLDAC
ncbi:MAG: indolepyruvate oxidoreductase, partial [Proteobacteria bacterium]|nr:indolepyruvate oxidoreductase [Pseudomonadota bacterium]